MNNFLQSELIKSIQRNRFYTANPTSYLPYLQMYIFDQLVENNKQDKEINSTLNTKFNILIEQNNKLFQQNEELNNKLDKQIKQNEELNNKFDKLIELLSKE